MNSFVGRPFQAVVATKNGRFRRPEKGVLHFFTASPVSARKRGFFNEQRMRRTNAIGLQNLTVRAVPLQNSSKPDANAFRLMDIALLELKRLGGVWNQPALFRNIRLVVTKLSRRAIIGRKVLLFLKLLEA